MHCSNEKIKLFLEWATFNELCFDSMVIKKDVRCEKKAKSFFLKEKMRHHSRYRKGMTNKEAFEIFRVAKNTIST